MASGKNRFALLEDEADYQPGHGVEDTLESPASTIMEKADEPAVFLLGPKGDKADIIKVLQVLRHRLKDVRTRESAHLKGNSEIDSALIGFSSEMKRNLKKKKKKKVEGTGESVAEPAARKPQFNPWVHLFGIVSNFWAGRTGVQLGMSPNSIADCKAFYVSGWVIFALVAWGLLTQWKREPIVALCLGLVMSYRVVNLISTPLLAAPC
jgi:hypothetical protein